jgi:hypothetical protein
MHDVLLTRLIKAVRGVCENRMKRYLIPVTVTVIARIVDINFLIPRLPVRSIISVILLNSNTNLFDTNIGYTWYIDNSIALQQCGVMQIKYQAGYITPADIPQEIKQAMLSEIAYRYTNRDDNQTVLSNRLSLTADSYLTPFINLSYI